MDRGAMKSMIVVSIMSAMLLLFAHSTEPRKRPFDAEDESISKPHMPGDTVAFAEAAAVSVGVPLLLMFGTFHINAVERREEMCFYASFLGSLLASSAIVENAKVHYGRLRPDFLSRCKPSGSRCTGSPERVVEGRKSFPSGHTSIACCGFVFLALFVSREARLPRLREKVGRALTGVLCLVFLMVPVGVGISRVMDNKHFATDVMGGAVVGALVGAAGFKYVETKVVPERYKGAGM